MLIERWNFQEAGALNKKAWPKYGYREGKQNWRMTSEREKTWSSEEAGQGRLSPDTRPLAQSQRQDQVASKGFKTQRDKVQSSWAWPRPGHAC